jgi:hypothetical protein
MAITALPQVDGIKSIQDLYNLMAGETTSTSGGTTTTTAGISPESMNAMLQSALSSTSGLAAVSSGQRSAGGYGSSVNTMLTNDLLTRTAGQIAQAASSKTTTTAPATTVKGGVTAEGGIKSAGFIAALNALDKTGAGDWVKKNVFGKDGAASEPVSETTQQTFSGDNSTGNPNYFSSSPSNMVTEAGTDQTAALDMGQTAIIDDNSSYQSYESQAETPVIEPVIDTSYTEDIIPMQEGGGYADGGLIGKKKSVNPILKMADGGSVTAAAKKQLGSMLGQQSNIVIDPKTGLMGKGSAGANEANVGQEATGPSQTVSTNTPMPISMGGGISASEGFGADAGLSGGFSAASDMASRAMSGETTKSDVSTISRGLSIVGGLTGNSNLSTVGTLGQIGASANPVKSAAETGINIASQGAYGKAKQAYTALANPSVESTVNFAASLNPITAALNAVANFVGAPNLGTLSSDAYSAFGPGPLGVGDIGSGLGTPVRTADSTNYSDGTSALTGMQVSMASENPDPMAALMDMTDAFDTVSATTPTTGSSNSGYGGNPTGPGGESISSGSDVGSSYGGSNVADGGHMEGPGTGTSDSIHDVSLSDGEFVLSADTVKAIGLDKLEALQAKYHTPKAEQEAKNPILKAANRRASAIH